MMSKKIKKIILKKNKTKIVSLTAYSKNFAKIIDKHSDIILVGDSMANVLYGMKDTHKLSLNNISDEFVKVMNIKEITVLPYCRPEVIDSVLKDKKAGSITLMENIRF